MCSAAGSRVPWHYKVASEGATRGLPGGISSGLEFPVPPPDPGPLPVVESGSRKLPGSSFPRRPTLTPSPTVNPTPDSQLDVGASPVPPTPNTYCRLNECQAHLHRPLSSYNRPASQQVPMCPGAQRLREVKGLSPGHTDQSVGQRPLPSKSPCFGGWGWTAQPHQTPA